MSAPSNTDASRKQKKFYPVIHCVDPFENEGIGHALYSTKTAMKNGADGVFLIGHEVRMDDLLVIYSHVRKQNPEIWIGINFLTLPATSREARVAFKRITMSWNPDLNAIWCDMLPKERFEVRSSVQIFGGVAFKYIDASLTGSSLARSCEDAIKCIDVITTSGDKTGQPPSLAKIQEMSSYINERVPLAIASGISEENVQAFLPYVDIFLVASSISGPDKVCGGLECPTGEKVHTLATLIHAGN